ncbi:glycosyl transferase family 39 [Segniliparus rotundus DSM 44985]|uniref:Glycosyl transferase family 39 n=1 Tax=Segniliparus rotundus (strain ATCC BAA-972 / CDC 1076 / CIP 108378 / DSM 44985 / JCM 13578) TaxID=640132 RepID=D6Z845_SEGRD|nr:glycosyltransferase family 39 protein [Segniliparus rotundus]ADG98125.1 glycosyl transferase family 39 [Segniliparus rotundus DSM 44985]
MRAPDLLEEQAGSAAGTTGMRAAPGRRRAAVPKHRWAVAALLVSTTGFWLIGLSRNGWANAFYSAAAQAGTQNWKAFLFGSSDAGNSITVDKPPAALWPMEISARIFGVNTWSLQVPQVLLGTASVALLYAIVGKRFGPGAGLLAGSALALTPVATLMFRYNNPDALLVFLMIAAVWALLRAVEDGRTRWIALCGALVGLGFLAKQLQVMLVVPALGATYLACGPRPLLVRLGQSLVGAVSALVAGGWWVLLVELTPARDRPYVGGSTNNSFLDLTFGYNGLERLRGGEGGGPPAPWGGSTGLTRMFSDVAGSQISWLLPAALVFLAAGLVLCRGAGRTDPARAFYLAWGGWLITTAGVFSFMTGLFHDYYTVALSPAVAALVGAGAAQLWRLRRTRGAALVLAATTAATAAWSWVLLGRSPEFLPPLRWAVLAFGAGAAVLIATAASAARWRSTVTLVSAALAVFAGPLAYCVQTLGTTHTGGIVTAGPEIPDAKTPFPQSASPGTTGGNSVGPALPGPANVTAGMVALLSKDAGGYRWAAAAQGSNEAAEYQLATGLPVMPLGGFIGGDPAPTLAEFQRYVAECEIHYYIAPGERGPRPPAGFDAPQEADMAQEAEEPSEADKIAAWVSRNYRAEVVDGVTVYDLTAAPTSGR